MQKTGNIRLYLAAAAAVVALNHHRSDASRAKPNIVFFLADDLGYGDVSWNNPAALTPNLHRLASEGVILSQHYACPVCSPSRASLMTGYYAIRTGVDRVISPDEKVGLDVRLTLMPEYLRRLGYRTYAVGKWHLGFCRSDFLPHERGFDVFAGFWSGEIDYFSRRMPSIGRRYDYWNNSHVHRMGQRSYSSYIFVEDAAEMIRSHAMKENNNRRPFFLYVSFNHPHRPKQATAQHLSKVDSFLLNLRRDQDVVDVDGRVQRRLHQGHVFSHKRRKHMSQVLAMDEAVGQIVAELERRHLLEDTIIVFTSDNGAILKDGGNNGMFSGQKGFVSEGGTRTPAFVYAPNYIKGGRVKNGMFHLSDWLPTLLEMSGHDPVDLLPSDIDGIGQFNYLKNDDGLSKRSELFYHHMMTGSAYRVGDFKLVSGSPLWPPPSNLSRFKLFDIRNDPKEKKDLSASLPHQTSRIHAKLLALAAQHPHWTRTKVRDFAAFKRASQCGTVGTGWCQPT